jgi:hypothetical protein
MIPIVTVFDDHFAVSELRTNVPAFRRDCCDHSGAALANGRERQFDL